LKEIVNDRAVASLILARIVYAVNWFNIASVFSLMALDFNEDVSGLGVLTGSFYIGLGIFQVPGGILAAKLGPKKTSIYGTMTASSAALLSGFATEFYQVNLLRFIVGLGMAFVFAPGVTLIAKYYRKQAEGFGVGLYNAAFYLGGAVGLFGWSVFAESTGWRPSLIASGALGITTALLSIAFIPPDNIRNDFIVRGSQLRKVLSDRWLLLLSLELFGVTAGATLITAFMVFYLEATLSASATLAGLVGSLVLISSLLASPIFGRLYDETGNARSLLFISGLLLAFGIAVASVPSLYAALVSTLVTGFAFGGGLTVGFSAARESKKVDAEYETLAVSWVNSLQLFAGVWSPVAFSFLVVRFGYTAAWLLAGLYTLLLTSVILLSRRKNTRQRT